MKILSNHSIYDEKTGIGYLLSKRCVGFDEDSETVEVVFLTSVHSPSESYGNSFEGEEAITLWNYLMKKSE